MASSDNPSILLVEDVNMFLSIAQAMLEGHELNLARTAKEGMEKFTACNPDIVFLDIALPDGNGMDMLQQMLAANPKAFIVMLTASRLIDDVHKAMEYGAKSYIMKPFSKENLQEILDLYHQTKGL